MKLGVALGCLAFVAGSALGQGLGDAAKKEQERRKQNQDKGVQARSFSDDDLGGSSGLTLEDDKEERDGQTGGRASSGSAPSGSAPQGEDRRASGKRKLADVYAHIAGQASQLVDVAQQYVGKGCETTVSDECGVLLQALDSLACAVGRNLDMANDLARQSWVLPGDVRELRGQYGLEERFWYELSSLARRHCKRR